MGKGFNNYMTKKFFHPASKENIKRVWMAQQKTDYEKKKQEDLMAQYQKEQEMLSNRALLGDEKAKLGLSFLYDAPPGMKKKEKEDDEPEYKFEWQRKYNAPREAYAKGDDTISDQPFGIEVRNIRCIKCRQWGHVNTDKICPLFGKNLTAEPPQPERSTSSLLEGLKEDGFQLKRSMLGRFMAGEEGEPVLEGGDEDDPEVQFLKSLTPKQKKKLLKKLNKLQEKGGKSKKDKKKKKKSKKRSSKDSDSDSSDVGKKHSHSKKTSKRQDSSFDESDDDTAKYHARGARPKDLKGKPSSRRDDAKRRRTDSSGSDMKAYDRTSSHHGDSRDRHNRLDRGHKSRPLKRESRSSDSESEEDNHRTSHSRPSVKNEHDRNGRRNEKSAGQRGRSPDVRTKKRQPSTSSESSSDSDGGNDGRRNQSPQNRTTSYGKSRQAFNSVRRGDRRRSPPRRSRSPVDRRCQERSSSPEDRRRRERSRSPVDRHHRERSSSPEDRRKGGRNHDDRQSYRRDRSNR